MTRSLSGGLGHPVFSPPSGIVRPSSSFMPPSTPHIIDKAVRAASVSSSEADSEHELNDIPPPEEMQVDRSHPTAKDDEKEEGREDNPIVLQSRLPSPTVPNAQGEGNPWRVRL